MELHFLGWVLLKNNYSKLSIKLIKNFRILFGSFDLLKKGKQIDYVGASAVELIGGGESSGSFREILIKGGKVTTAGYR